MKAIQSDPKTYDVIIVGGGPAGLFAAYYLGEHSDMAVLLIEKGKGTHRRKCPIKEDQGCVKCNPCNILCGVGGAGLFSDGKLNYIHKLGKTDLTQFMPQTSAEDLIDETEKIFNHFGMDGLVYPTDMAEARNIRKQAKRYGIDLMIIKQKHLGSDCLPGHIEGHGQGNQIKRHRDTHVRGGQGRHRKRRRSCRGSHQSKTIQGPECYPGSRSRGLRNGWGAWP